MARDPGGEAGAGCPLNARRAGRISPSALPSWPGSSSSRSLRALGLTLLAAVFGVLPWLLYAIAFQRGGEEWTVVAPLALLALVMVVLHWSRVGSRAWTRVESEGARVIG